MAKTPKRRQYSGLDRRGGVRQGAGRPKTINWNLVKGAARTGAPEEDIIRGLGIPQSALQQGDSLKRLRDVIEEGHAHYRLQLRSAAKKKALGKKGSVNTLALITRNELDWDSNVPATQQAPDVTGMASRVLDLIDKLARKGPSEPAAAAAPTPGGGA